MSGSTAARVALMMDDPRHDLRLLREPYIESAFTLSGLSARAWVGTYRDRPVTITSRIPEERDLPPCWVVQYEDDGTTAVGMTITAALEAEA